MEKNYPRLYNQNDYGTVDLGNSRIDTIQSGGCFDTCCAIKATFYGHPTDPIQMNRLFTDKNIYISLNADGSNKDLLPDNAVAQVFTDIKYISTLNYEPIPTDLNHIKDLLNDPATTLTIRINFGGGNFHFVEAAACDGSVLHIANPISGKVEDFSQRYGNPVTANLHVLVFTGPVPPAQTTVSDQTQSGSSPLAVRFSQAITKSTNFDAVADYFGLNSDQRVSPEAGMQTVGKIKFLQEQIDALHKQVDTLAKPPIVVSGSGTTNGTGVPPQEPTSPAKPVDSKITFTSGASPVSGNPSDSVTSPTNTTSSPLNQSGAVSLKEFVKALWHTLFT